MELHQMHPKEGEHIAVWFSCGAASAVAARVVLDDYRESNRVSIINNPIQEEHEDNQRFLRDVETWLQHPIEQASSQKYPSQSCQEVWAARNFMSGPLFAPCTLELKKRPRQAWERQHKPDYTVLGFTAEEAKRAARFQQTERDSLLTPLIEKGYTKQDCFDIIQAAGIQLPSIYLMGFSNANCIGCVKATSPTYWNLVREKFPAVFQEREQQSKYLGARLARYKGERVQLADLPPDAKGRPLKDYSFECGIFCEEDPF